jgi:hypothetical protein
MMADQTKKGGKESGRFVTSGTTAELPLGGGGEGVEEIQNNSVKSYKPSFDLGFTHPQTENKTKKY